LKAAARGGEAWFMTANRCASMVKSIELAQIWANLVFKLHFSQTFTLPPSSLAQRDQLVFTMFD
jgi:hypothetical protein